MCRPDLIDPALLRPGRLDVLLYVGVAEDSNSKLKVLQALTRKFALEADIDLPSIAAKCPTTFTGADMYALSSDAWMAALKRTVAAVSNSLMCIMQGCADANGLLTCDRTVSVPAKMLLSARLTCMSLAQMPGQQLSSALVQR